VFHQRQTSGIQTQEKHQNICWDLHFELGPYSSFYASYLFHSIHPNVYIFLIFLLLPSPLLVFLLVETIKTLCGALSVPADGKTIISTIVVVVLLLYSLLFPLNILWFLVEDNFTLLTVVSVCIYCNPLADTILYLLIQKSVLDNVLAFCVFVKCLTIRR
ncbi:hypothetical protein XENOCAPTIV_024296, partial [Xenoophorus captivus]